MKQAKLVSAHFIARVIVEEDASEEQIIEAAREKFILQMDNNPIGDHIEEIMDDKECPATEEEALTAGRPWKKS